MSDAFRAAEILLGAGGFGLVVLDVDAPRAGAGGWPRLARAAERTRSTLLVVALRRAAGTFAALGLELGARRVRWSGGPGRLVLLEGIDARVTVARSRIGRPGQALVVRQACAAHLVPSEAGLATALVARAARVGLGPIGPGQELRPRGIHGALPNFCTGV